MKPIHLQSTSLQFASYYNLELQQIDVKGAYLNGKLEENVYMQQLEGFIEPGTKSLVCKLNKGIYRLKQLGWVWHQTLKHELEKIGFKSGDADTTIYCWFRDNGSIELIGWYVDDGLLAANSTKSMDHMVNDIWGSFDIQDLGELDCLLRIRISRNQDLRTIHISQPSFINMIARRFNITPGRSITSLMDPSMNLQMAMNLDDNLDIPYTSLIGSINYCAVSVWPDISYATNKCMQFTSQLNLSHWEAVKRIVWYLLHTREFSILYKQDGNGIEGYAHNLAGYTDADFAGDINDRKSTTGWLFTFNGSLISWASNKQGLVTRSSMESELIAGSFASTEGIWLIQLGKDFKHIFTPILLFTDNQSFMIFSKNDVNNNWTKHINTHFHYAQDQVMTGNIWLHYISSIDNQANILTKPLWPRKHAHLLNQLGVCFGTHQDFDVKV